MSPFEFLQVELPPDRDLRLILSERVPLERSPWGVPAYTFHMHSPQNEYLGCIRLRVGWKTPSSAMPARSATQ